MRLKFFLLLIMFVVSSAVCTSCASAAVDPSTWPKPWSQNIKLKINWNHPFNKSAYHDTWGSPDESYTIDFMPPDNLQGSNDDIEIYSPVDGTVICSNLYSDVRDETLGGISSRKSCENGHYSIDEYGAYGQHIIIEPDGDEVASANDKEPKFSKNTFIIGHLRMDSKPSFVKENGKYKVKKGQFIGYMGDTGEGPKHMHFELVNHYRSSVNEQDCNAVKLFGFSESDFTNQAEKLGSFPLAFTIEGEYTAVSDGTYYSDLVKQTDSPLALVSGYLNITGDKEGANKEWLILQGEVDFEQGAWLQHLGDNIITFNKKIIGENSGNTLREYEAAVPEFLHFGNGSEGLPYPYIHRAKETRYRLEQKDKDTLVWIVRHKYSEVRVTLKRNSSSSSLQSSAAKKLKDNKGVLSDSVYSTGIKH